MLTEQGVRSTWPEAINLPTASGKTACIDAAIFALAATTDQSDINKRMPRRIWFVVDRRIVVDEAFERARAIAAKLASATSGPLEEVATRLRAMSGIADESGKPKPLAVARLRGGAWRDDGWARVPTQPAVICSTVDQVGSALLFRSYGHSDRTASIWAGLAANDSLILLDEAHCAVPFLQTLHAIARFRDAPWASAPIKTPFRFSILSATPPTETKEEVSFPRPAERTAALDHPLLQERLAARKLATLREVKGKGDTDEFIATASEQASSFLGNGRQRVAVMVNRVATAESIAAQAHKDVGDRAEVILTALDTPTVAVVLTGDYVPGAAVLARAEEAGVPLISVESDTVTAADGLRHLFGRLRVKERSKIDLIAKIIDDSVDVDRLVADLKNG